MEAPGKLGVPCVGHPTQGLQKPCSRWWPRSPLSRFFLPAPTVPQAPSWSRLPSPRGARHLPHPGAQRQESLSRPLPPPLHLPGLAGRVRLAWGPLSGTQAGTPKCYKQGTQPMGKEPLSPPSPLPRLPPKQNTKEHQNQANEAAAVVTGCV